MKRKTGHLAEKTGHADGTFLARARPYGDKPRMSQCPVVPKNGTQRGKRGTGHSGLSASTSHPTRAGSMTWAHISALNIMADHAAGISVSPMKLEAARKLLAA